MGMLRDLFLGVSACAAAAWSQQTIDLSLSANGQTEPSVYHGSPILLEAAAFLVDGPEVAISWPAPLQLTVRNGQGAIQNWEWQTLGTQEGPPALSETESATAVWGLSGAATASIPPGEYSIRVAHPAIGSSRLVLIKVEAAPLSPTPEEEALNSRIEARYEEFQGNLARALEILDTALSRKPRDIGILSQRADLLEEMGRIEDAMAAAEAALDAFSTGFPLATHPPRGLMLRLGQLLEKSAAAVLP
jgi:tetratricopeptide (TPR) repeat protein